MRNETIRELIERDRLLWMVSIKRLSEFLSQRRTMRKEERVKVQMVEDSLIDELGE